MIWAALTGAWQSVAKLPRGFHIALGVIALFVALLVLHKCAVRDAIEADRKAVEAETAKKALGAERAANEADAARQGEIKANDASTRKAIDDAARENPEGAKAGVGPATRAALESLRQRAVADRGSHDKEE